MTTTRIDIEDYLIDELQDLAEEISNDPVDYSRSIDAALRRLGETNMDEPTLADTFTEAAYALALYDALRRFWTMTARRVDTITGQNFTTTRSQLFLNIEKLLKEAADRCALLGYPVVGIIQEVTQSSAISSRATVRAAW